MNKNKVFLWLLVIVLAGVAVFSAIEGTQAFPVTLSQIDESTAQSLNVIFDMSEKEMLLPGVAIDKTVTVKNEGNVDTWLWYYFAITDTWVPYISLSCTAPGWRLLETVEKKDGYTIYTVLCNDVVAANSTVTGTLTLLLSANVEYFHGGCYCVSSGEKIKIADSADVVTSVEAFAVQHVTGIDSIEDAYDTRNTTIGSF